jgi:hypothetical protein
MKSAEVKSVNKNESPQSLPTLTQEDLLILKAPFAKDVLGVKVQSFSKDRARAMLVLYLQHTDVMARLEEVDPAWTSEVLGEERSGDSCYVRTRLTIKGVARENVGEGGDPKAAYSDALKRAAMLFGVGRYLYDSSTVWTEYNEARDRFKQWSYADYERASRGHEPVAAPTPSGGPAVKPKTEGIKPGLKREMPVVAAQHGAKNRDQFNRVLMNLYRPYLAKFPETKFVELLYGRYNVGETRLMTLEQLDDLVQFMDLQLKSAETSNASKTSATA